MNTQFLSLRMANDEALLITQLQAALGGTKSDVVKQALRLLATAAHSNQVANAPSLHSLGAGRFGRHGDSARQSVNIKSTVRQRLAAKHDT